MKKNKIFNFFKQLFKFTQPGVVFKSYSDFRLTWVALKDVMKAYIELIDQCESGVVRKIDVPRPLMLGICHASIYLGSGPGISTYIMDIIDYHNINNQTYKYPTLFSTIDQMDDPITKADIETCIIPRLKLVRNIIANLEQLNARKDGTFLYKI